MTVEARGTDLVLANGILRAVIDREGRVTSLTDLSSGREFAGDRPMNEWRLYKNVEPIYDAWELDAHTLDRPADEPITASARLLSHSALRAEVEVTRSFSGSASRQIVRLDAASCRLDFITEVDWHERHKLLKVHFPHSLLTTEALHEIQFGHVARPTHRSQSQAAAMYEVPQQRWTAVCEDDRCFAVLNDSSYGVSTDRDEIALTLLRAPQVPDDTCDQGGHRLTYSVTVSGQPFAEGQIVREGYSLNMPVRVVPGTCAPQSGIRCEGAIVEHVKPAEDGHGCVVRVYQPQHAHTQARLILPREAQIFDCGLAEDRAEPLGRASELTFALKPFEIRSFRVCEG